MRLMLVMAFTHVRMLIHVLMPTGLLGRLLLTWHIRCLVLHPSLLCG